MPLRQYNPRPPPKLKIPWGWYGLIILALISTAIMGFGLYFLGQWIYGWA